MNRRVAALLAAFVVVLGLSWSRDVEAHAIGASNGDYRLDNGVLVAELTFARGEIVALVPELDADHHGAVTAADLAAHRAQVAAKIVPKIVVQAGSAPCPGEMDELALTQEDGIVVRARWKCPGGST